MLDVASDRVANVKANRARASRRPRSEPLFRAIRLSGMLGKDGQQWKLAAPVNAPDF